MLQLEQIDCFSNSWGTSVSSAEHLLVKGGWGVYWYGRHVTYHLERLFCLHSQYKILTSSKIPAQFLGAGKRKIVQYFKRMKFTAHLFDILLVYSERTRVVRSE